MFARMDLPPATDRASGRTDADLRATTVRMSDPQWDRVEAAAQREGISVAQWLRETAIMRLAYEAGQAAGPAAEMWPPRPADHNGPPET
jgi:hypothetical protein